MMRFVDIAASERRREEIKNKKKTKTKMFLEKKRFSWRWLRAGSISDVLSAELLIATCCFLLASVGLTLAQQLDTQTPADSSPQLHQEILVQPNSQVRIECKLPQMSSSNLRLYYWNFQRSSIGAAKPYILCFEGKCVDEATFGIQLEMDRDLGTYDLLINNVTYELNDGLYYCDYKDSNPETKQTINREFRLTVLIPPQPPAIVPATPSPAREAQEYQLSCLTQGGNPEPNITWYRNEQLLGAGSLPALRVEQTRSNQTTSSSLSWLPTIDDHQAVFKCVVWNKAMNSMQPYEREFRLQVEYAPRISVGAYNPLKALQGSQVTLPCLVEANPPVKGIRWFKDGRLISNQFNHTLAELRVSDSSVYSCVADNGIAPMLSQSHAGQVIGPASSLFSLFGLASSAAVRDSDSKSPSAVEAQLQLQVLFGPRVQLKPSKAAPLQEGDAFALNCSVEASPAATEFVWTKLEDPSFRRLSQAHSSLLEFQAVGASDAGNYTCTATNRLEPSGYAQAVERQGSASALLQVRHKPGVAEISLGVAGETELGAKTLVQCRAKPAGYPEAQYRFWKYAQSSRGHLEKLYLNKQANASPVYTIYSAKADDEGKYGCVAVNEMGASSEADGDLIVNELPTIVQESARRDEDLRPPGDFPYAITVRAAAKPEPKVTWFHRSPVDGRRVELSAQEASARFKIETSSKPEVNQVRPRFNVVSTLTFKQPLEVDDRGLYSVEFSNGLSRSATDHFQLHINHPPVPAPRNLPVSSAAGGHLLAHQRTIVKAGFEPGETVNLTCRVSACPKPEFYWYNGHETDKDLSTNPRYRASSSNPVDDIWESTLSFVSAQESDYGEYLCASANTDPQTSRISESVSISVILSRKSAPEPPSQLEAVEASQDSISLQWLAGFDGGFPHNHYLVQYAPDDGAAAGSSLLRRFPNGEPGGAYAEPANQLLDGQSTSFPRLVDCQSANPCTINQLIARQAYVFRVRAKNELGLSEFSNELRATTRANVSQIPRLMDASLDAVNNVLHFRVEPGSDYLLSSLNARIEWRPSASSNSNSNSNNNNNLMDQLAGQSDEQAADHWRAFPPYPMRQEKAEAYLDIQQNTEQLRISLCSRSNESLCGPDYVISVKSATSSFLQAERGSVSILICMVTLIVVLAALTTKLHTCCTSVKDKKADAIERAETNIDNKPVSNGASAANNLPASHKSSHGSTTSTNSTSANNTNGLQSMDSINNALNAGSASDHSSDHSRQAKLDSMLPPNYNHYADRASIMMEQQQQQQLLQQQALMADKLGSPFGLQNSALLSVANQQQSQQMPSPMINANLNYFTYSQSQLDPQQQQSMSLDQQNSSMMEANMMLGQSALDQDGQQQQQMWSSPMDEYNYNALSYPAAVGQQQQSLDSRMIDPAYGTTGNVMMSQQSAAYDNSANNGQFQAYLNAYQQQDSAQQYQQQRAQYQQEIAVAQQQMYGTLTRNGYSSANNANNINSSTSNNNNIISDISSKSPQINTNTPGHNLEQQYSTTNGLIQPPQMTPAPQESDYGTTGARNGRLIREIIV